MSRVTLRRVRRWFHRRIDLEQKDIHTHSTRTPRFGSDGLTLSVGTKGSINPRNEPIRACHVGSILVAESLKHHPLLVANTRKEQRTKANDTRQTRDPVRQQKCL